MKILFSCGGTGGHINPAISIADYIKAKHPDCEILFVGGEHGLEKHLIPKAGYSLKMLDVRGFKRSLSPKNLLVLYKALMSVRKAKKILNEFKPDVVIGTGGYASYSAVKAASKLGIPTLIHEQNAFPGITTRQLSTCADKVCISFEDSRKYFEKLDNSKLIVTGNPVTPKLLTLNKEEARKELGIKNGEISILSFGGSLGAATVNRVVLELIASLNEDNYFARKSIKMVHSTGRSGYKQNLEKASELKIESLPNVEIKEYIYDMPLRLAAADIVIARAGAITIAEASLLGKALILIPSPNVAENHQYKNAKVLKDAGAAELFVEEELCSSDAMIETVKDLVEHPEKISLLSNNIKSFAKPNATMTISEMALDLIK